MRLRCCERGIRNSNTAYNPATKDLKRGVLKTAVSVMVPVLPKTALSVVKTASLEEFDRRKDSHSHKLRVMQLWEGEIDSVIPFDRLEYELESLSTYSQWESTYSPLQVNFVCPCGCPCIQINWHRFSSPLLTQSWYMIVFVELLWIVITPTWVLLQFVA